MQYCNCSQKTVQMVAYLGPAAHGPVCIPMRSLRVSSGRWQILKCDTWSSRSRAILQILKLYKAQGTLECLSQAKGSEISNIRHTADLNDVSTFVGFRQSTHNHVRVSNCLHLTRYATVAILPLLWQLGRIVFRKEHLVFDGINSNTPFTRYNRLSNPLYNRFDNRLYRVKCKQTSNRVVKPVVKPVWRTTL